MASYYQRFTNFIDESYDDRLSNYFLMGSIYKIITILVIYLLFVKKIGPKFMESRQPYDLSRIMPIYNAIQVLLNLYCTIWVVGAMIRETKEYHDCPLVDFSRTERGYELAHIEYYYYLLKILDLMDTVFIILKKNYRQASVLHIYHHTIMGFASHIHLQYYPGGVYCIPGGINCTIHVIMYSYFFVTTIQPDLKKSIWWKKYITQCQIIQFIINIFLYSRVALHNNCEYSKLWAWFGSSQNVVFLFMFLNFYIRNYLFDKSSKNKIK